MDNLLIKRDLLDALLKAFRYFPVITLTGPRQSGKTFRADYFDGLHYLQKVLKERVASTNVVYDGEQELEQPYDGYCNFRNWPK